MTALNRAIRDPRPIAGLAARSPMYGLARRSVGFIEVLAQSVGAVAPSAAAATMPALVAARAGSGTLVAVLAAGILITLVASSINQFTRRMAATGSLYTFAAKGLGVGAGFATGAALLVGYGFVSMFALLGGSYYTLTLVSHFVPGVASSRPLSVVLVVAFAVLCLVILTRGIRVSTRVTLFVELASIVAVLVLIVVLLGSTPASSLTAHSLVGPVTVPQLAAGATVAVTAFVGFESAATLGVEARRPFATIPRTIRWTVLGAGLLFLLSTYTQLTGFDALGTGLAHSATPVNDLAAHAGVAWIGLVLDLGLASSFVACALASMTALSRVLFSLGREGIAPKVFGRAHPRFRTPYVALYAGMAVVVAVPTLLVAAGYSPWQAMGIILVCAAAGYMVAYAIVCVASPLFLRRIGEVTFGSVVTAVVAVVALVGALGIDLAMELTGPRQPAVWMLVALAAATGGLYAWCRRTRPAALDRIGLYDETTSEDVLGGAPSRSS